MSRQQVAIVSVIFLFASSVFTMGMVNIGLAIGPIVSSISEAFREMGNQEAAALRQRRNDVFAVLVFCHIMLAFSIVSPLYFMCSVRREGEVYGRV